MDNAPVLKDDAVRLHRVPWALLLENPLGVGCEASLARPNLAYICPSCKSEVTPILPKDPSIRPHFRHHHEENTCNTDAFRHVTAQRNLRVLLEASNQGTITLRFLVPADGSQASASRDPWQVPRGNRVEIERPSDDGKYKFDVALMNQDSVMMVVEILNTHSVPFVKAYDLPKPWFEIDAAQLVKPRVRDMVNLLIRQQPVADHLDIPVLAVNRDAPPEDTPTLPPAEYPEGGPDTGSEEAKIPWRRIITQCYDHLVNRPEVKLAGGSCSKHRGTRLHAKIPGSSYREVRRGVAQVDFADVLLMGLDGHTVVLGILLVGPTSFRSRMDSRLKAFPQTSPRITLSHQAVKDLIQGRRIEVNGYAFPGDWTCPACSEEEYSAARRAEAAEAAALAAAEKEYWEKKISLFRTETVSRIQAYRQMLESSTGDVHSSVIPPHFMPDPDKHGLNNAYSRREPVWVKHQVRSIIDNALHTCTENRVRIAQDHDSERRWMYDRRHHWEARVTTCFSEGGLHRILEEFSDALVERRKVKTHLIALHQEFLTELKKWAHLRLEHLHSDHGRIDILFREHEDLLGAATTRAAILDIGRQCADRLAQLHLSPQALSEGPIAPTGYKPPSPKAHLDSRTSQWRDLLHGALGRVQRHAQRECDGILERLGRTYWSSESLPNYRLAWERFVSVVRDGGLPEEPWRRNFAERVTRVLDVSLRSALGDAEEIFALRRKRTIETPVDHQALQRSLDDATGMLRDAEALGTAMADPALFHACVSLGTKSIAEVRQMIPREATAPALWQTWVEIVHNPNRERFTSPWAKGDAATLEQFQRIALSHHLDLPQWPVLLQHTWEKLRGDGSGWDRRQLIRDAHPRKDLVRHTSAEGFLLWAKPLTIADRGSQLSIF